MEILIGIIAGVIIFLIIIAMLFCTKKQLLLIVIVITIVAAVITAIFIFCNYSSTTPDNSSVKATTEANVLVKEGFTPLTVDIHYKFQFRTEGKPINVKFNGIEEVVPFAGEGDFNAPKNLRSGETIITSGDTNHLKIWVKVYKIIKI